MKSKTGATAQEMSEALEKLIRENKALDEDIESLLGEIQYVKMTEVKE